MTRTDAIKVSVCHQSEAALFKRRLLLAVCTFPVEAWIETGHNSGKLSDTATMYEHGESSNLDLRHRAKAPRENA
jgi:hypothetical protein